QSDRQDLADLEDPTRISEESLNRHVQHERARAGNFRKEFNQRRRRDRKIRPMSATQRRFHPAKIENLLKEGQEVIVQVAKDPIANKGARLTCHVSLPGRHLVCMPTIDHVGVSRRIEKEGERRRLRTFVEKHRPRGMGFIVRTASSASGNQDSESWIRQDVEYLADRWEE